MRISDWSSDVCSSDLVNAGGVMNVALEITGYNRERAMRQMRTISHNLARIYEIAERDGIPTYKAADRMAEERIVVMGKLQLPLGRTTPTAQEIGSATCPETVHQYA